MLSWPFNLYFYIQEGKMRSKSWITKRKERVNLGDWLFNWWKKSKASWILKMIGERKERLFYFWRWLKEFEKNLKMKGKHFFIKNKRYTKYEKNYRRTHKIHNIDQRKTKHLHYTKKTVHKGLGRLRIHKGNSSHCYPSPFQLQIKVN